jgi:hypothetical protein
VLALRRISADGPARNPLQAAEPPRSLRFVHALRQPGILDCAVAALVLAALWIATRPYSGIVHDARFYILQGLAHIDPIRYANDLYFRFGSQDDFSLSGFLTARALMRLGLEQSCLLFTLGGEALWLIGAGALVAVLLSSPMQRVVALAAIFALPPDYGGTPILSYGGPCFTPRPFAEAFVMMAIVAALKRRWLACAVAAAAATAMHPLIAAPGLLVVVGVLAAEDRRWWLVPVAAAAGGVGLAVAGVEPFARLWTVFSGDWLAVVLHRCRWAFFGGWQDWDFLRLLVQAEIVAIAWPDCSPNERRLLKLLGLAVGLSLGVSVVGADLLHDVLIVNLQPSRVLWLASLIVNLVAGLALLRLFAAGRRSRWPYAIGLLGYLMSITTIQALAPATMALGAALALRSKVEQTGPAPRALSFLAAGVTAAAAGLMLGLAGLLAVFLAGFPRGGWLRWDYAAIGLAIAAGACLPLGRRRTALALAALAATAAVAVSDQRDGWERLTAATGPLPQVAALLGSARNVYWEDGVELLWFRLRMPSYYSCDQGTGAMFYRRTALEYARRGRGLASLNTDDFVDDSGDVCPLKADTNAVGPKSRQQIVAACDALPDLDMIVLMSKVNDLPAPFWDAPAPQYRNLADGRYQKADRYYFYDCRKLRAG